MKNETKEAYTKTLGFVSDKDGKGNAGIGIKFSSDRVRETLTLSHDGVYLSVPYREVESVVRIVRNK